MAEPDFLELLFAFEATPPGTPGAREAQHHVLMNLHKRLVVREANERISQMVTNTARIVLLPVAGAGLLKLLESL